MAKRLMWFTFSAQAQHVQANVRIVQKRGELALTGEDQNIAFEKLSKETRDLVLDAADAVADELGASVYQPPEEKE